MSIVRTRSLFCVCFLTLVLGSLLQAQTFTTLVNFFGADGANPQASLIQGTDGALYGTTLNGGLGSCWCGTLFRISTQGSLVGFPLNTHNGTGPTKSLLLGTDGNYYGTTHADGAYGYGTVFKITPAGVLTKLHDFCADRNDCMDGYSPNELVQGFDGNLYGTTAYGGDPSCAAGCGTVFKITQSGAFTTLYRFRGDDGDHPSGRLVQGLDSSLYGVTLEGGGLGTIFRITPAGAVTRLHTFDGDDGSFPNGGMILASDGGFYGTTYAGGPSNDGTLFRIAPTGRFTVLHHFNSAANQPYSELVQGSDRSLYGTTYYGGDQNCNYPYGCGAIYRLSLDGTFTIPHSFESTDGQFPTAGLVQATNGVFYGTVPDGGNSTYGTLYSLDMGLGPFVTFVRNAGRAGSVTSVLGQGFTGTSAVAFNGTAGSFTVASDTLIYATVPPGATTGYVTVTTPTGTLTSNKKFVVVQ
jgi:uncharacterized repeat protein (TIGR03803 family)